MLSTIKEAPKDLNSANWSDREFTTSSSFDACAWWWLLNKANRLVEAKDMRRVLLSMTRERYPGQRVDDAGAASSWVYIAMSRFTSHSSRRESASWSLPFTHRTPCTSGTSKLNPLLELLLLLAMGWSIQQQLPTTISAALAMASKTTWLYLAPGPFSCCCCSPCVGILQEDILVFIFTNGNNRLLYSYSIRSSELVTLSTATFRCNV